jgi:hypothetical protein
MEYVNSLIDYLSPAGKINFNAEGAEMSQRAAE